MSSEELGSNNEEVSIELPFSRQFDKYGTYEAHARGALSRFEGITLNNESFKSRNQVINACLICINKITKSETKLAVRKEYLNYIASIEKETELKVKEQDDRIDKVSIAFAGIVDSLLADFMDTNTTNITVEFAAKPVYMSDFEEKMKDVQDYEYNLKNG